MAGQGEVIITMEMATQEVKTRGLFVDGTGELSATNRAIGCLVEPTTATETHAAVQVGGIALAQLGATLSAGAICAAAADGQLVAAATTDGAELLACAVLLEGGAAGSLVRAKIL